MSTSDLYGETTANFTQECFRGKAIVTHEGVPRQVALINDTRRIPLFNARSTSGLSMDTSGFAIIDSPTTFTDFEDDAAVKAAYYENVVEVVRKATGCNQAFVLNHLRRNGRHWDEGGTGTPGGGVYALAVHSDVAPYFEVGALSPLPGRARKLLAGKHWGIFNVWRSIDPDGPVEMMPLAICDPRSVSGDDIVYSEVPEGHRPEHSRKVRLFTQRLIRNSAQRFYVFPRMTTQEALVFRQYATWCPPHMRQCFHSAVEDPGSPADPRQRRSIEVRVIAVFGEDAETSARQERLRNEMPATLQAEAKL